LSESYRYGYPSTRPRTHSSPPQHLSTPTRLTLPVGQHAPGWAQPKDDAQRAAPLQHANAQGTSRPMSRQIRCVRSVSMSYELEYVSWSRGYAYIPPETARPPGSLLVRTRQVPNVIHTSPTIIKSQAQSTQQTSGPIHHSVIRQQNVRAEGMGPPPVPLARLGTPAHSSASSRNHIPTGRRFVPAQTVETARPQPPRSHGPQRFFPRADNNLQRATQTWQPNTTSPSGAGYG
jgi:hypothetical protein